MGSFYPSAIKKKENEIKKLFSNKWKITADYFPNQSIEARRGREKLIVFEKL